MYVSAGKLRVLQALGLTPEYTRLLTADDKVPQQSGIARRAVHASMGVVCFWLYTARGSSTTVVHAKRHVAQVASAAAAGSAAAIPGAARATS